MTSTTHTTIEAAEREEQRVTQAILRGIRTLRLEGRQSKIVILVGANGALKVDVERRVERLYDR